MSPRGYRRCQTVVFFRASHPVSRRAPGMMLFYESFIPKILRTYEMPDAAPLSQLGIQQTVKSA